MTNFNTADLELLDVADRLVEAFPEAPTGTILRCLSQAVHRSRELGVPSCRAIQHRRT